MECIPHQKIFMDGEEADDVIASYIMKHSSNIILFSSDKDMWQLLNIHPNLKIYTGATIIVDKTMCLKHFDTEDFNMIPLHKMIRGDAGDNVKSVKNFPFKKSKIAYDECDGTFDDYLDKLIKHFGEEGEYTKKILDNLHLVRLNYFVTKLKYDLKYNAVSFRKADQDKWNKLCYSFEIPSLLNSPLLRIF
jgi:5'-3' exonuclease